MALIIVISAIVDWQHAIWLIVGGIWHPDLAVIGLICGVMGAKVVQKRYEK